MIAEPPVEAGAEKVTDIAPLPAALAVPMVGAPGTVAGVTAADAVDETLLPLILLAMTVKVYAVPLLRPVML